jgi:predicted Rdx family selenoprotein
VEAKTTPGQTSQFDVVRDGQIIFSKQAVGRFPEPDEILPQLA